MSKKAYVEMLATVGWTINKIDGEFEFQIDLGDRVLRSYDTFSKTTKQFIWRDRSNVWFANYANLRSYIWGGTDAFTASPSIIRRKNSDFRKDGEATLEFFAQSSEALKVWALGIDPDAEIKRMAEIKPRYMLTASSHIAALARLGNVERLEMFDKEMQETGKVEILHPLIKPEMVARALDIARRVQGGEDAYEVVAALIET